MADFFDGEVPDEFKNLDVRMVEQIHNEILQKGTDISWNDISGLEGAKTAVYESVIWPMLNPQMFKGIRAPPKGILLFGPPGTGKTLIGRAIATESKATFFNISASSLMSKWIGEGEKLVRTLFAVAKFKQPSVIFIDEIDSLLSKRTEGDSDTGTRRMKTEFLVHLDGAGTSGEDRILIVGATNLPGEIDDAVRRRLSKRLYIPLPNATAREGIINKLLGEFNPSITKEELADIVKRTEGYSGADMTTFCGDVALNPLRDLNPRMIEKISEDNLRSINMSDFEKSLKTVKPSVSQKDILAHEEWNKTYGSF
jgi:SpoVK/Ycf46/Vps4 family AAA+-type ATPase